MLGAMLNRFCQNSDQLMSFHKSSVTFYSSEEANDGQIMRLVFFMSHTKTTLANTLIVQISGESQPKSRKFFPEQVSRIAEKLQNLKTDACFQKQVKGHSF